ncbi:MAG: arsenosugar biosynthesis radical SAM (seleno)protein ArsS [Armatimonadota bacterium]
MDSGLFPVLDPFQARLRAEGLSLRRGALRVLQVNVGKLCNQVCRHCHVDAGPHRTEQMTAETAEEVLAAAERLRPETVDLTGGAPELNPHFERLVTGARRLGCRVIDRCNLTVLLLPGKERLAGFLAEQRVEVVASLPCYLGENVDAQRGRGVFEQSLEALRRLNALGYGDASSGLELCLVYNPLGPQLPPPQAELETAYREELRARYGLRFTRLYALTNMPIHRFAQSLHKQGRYQEYLSLLAGAFNPAAVEGLMCRDTLSIGWDGAVYDCDFNQMLELPAGAPARHVRDLQPGLLPGAPIATAEHCFGCTAGAGSSCGGAVAG